ncbi:MAG TPA: PAS domain S-box protein, partial [Methanocella sp.]|nr:PAS domain S-box protein [Methanocella sp.]
AIEGYEKAYNTGSVRDYPLEIRHRDGHTIPVLYNASVYKDETGKVVGVFAAARDITELKRAEEKARNASAYNRSLIEVSLDPLVTISPEGKITDVNVATEKATGYPRDKLIDTDFSNYFTIPAKAKEGYLKVFEVGFVTDYPLEIRHRDGHTTPVLYNASVYKDEAGKVIGVFAAARDITERRRAEEAARIASAYNRSLIEASLDPLVTISPDGVIMDVNKATENVTGYTREDLIGTDFSIYFTDPEKAREGYRIVFEKGSVRDYPLEIRNKNGRVTPVLYNAAVYWDETGKVVGVFAAARDMTERKMAEEKIDRQIMLIDLSPDAIMVRRLDGTITLWSRGAESLYGWKKDEAMGKQTHALFQTRFPEPLSKINEQLARTGRWSGELVHTTKDGRQVTVQSWWLARGAKPGQVDEILESNIDITELKRTQLLAEQTTRLQEQARIIDLAHVIIRDPKSHIISWTNGDELLYGFTKEEAVGMVSHELFQTIFTTSKEAIDETLEHTGHWQGELVQTAKDGHKVIVASHQVLYREHGKPVAILEVNNDITERKRVEDALKESESNLTRAQLIARIGSWNWDLKDDKIVCSDEFYRIFGLGKQDYLTFGQFLDMLHRDDRERVDRAIEAAIHNRQPYSIDYRIVLPDGNERFIHAEGEINYSRTGEPLRFFGTVQDITENKIAEQMLTSARDQAKREKERALEAMQRAELYLDIMGHDINNLNQAALTNLDLIKGDENLTEDQNETLDDALNSVKGSAAIIDNVRKIQAITQEKLSMHPEDLDLLIKECIAEVSKPAEYAVKINYTPRPGSMIMGTALMKEVFNNIITNAIKHAGRDVTIDIRINEAIRLGKKFYNISIADDGPGIPDELKPKLFARFQRGDTKAHGKGLGLFIVKSLVETAGGNVTVEDRVSGDYTQGARFIVSLPVAEEYK